MPRVAVIRRTDRLLSVVDDRRADRHQPRVADNNARTASAVSAGPPCNPASAASPAVST
ncbi:hypothetical protein J2T17_005476 [Paenibacillus mucilaginosus]|uniref:hypothetical protein n=1 Tax=Paenibacillus mucilaginosus TaxID=61624 RepID=UPI003D19E09B